MKVTEKSFPSCILRQGLGSTYQLNIGFAPFVFIKNEAKAAIYAVYEELVFYVTVHWIVVTSEDIVWTAKGRYRFC